MIVVRAATLDDVAGMARAHVVAWQQTYRGMVPDAVLDAADAAARRERMWRTVLADGATMTAAVADRDGEIVGFASSGAVLDPDIDAARQLYTLYLLADAHGSGAG